MKHIKSSIEVLSREEVLLIHNNALKTLANLGMRVPNDEVQEMCAGLPNRLGKTGGQVSGQCDGAIHRQDAG